MGNAAEIRLRQQPIAAIAGTGSGAVHHAHTLPPVQVKVPPLPTGGVFFEQWNVREVSQPGTWRNEYYESIAPPLFVLNDVLVYGQAGILAVGDVVIAETLSHTLPGHHFYRPAEGGVVVRPNAVTRLRGIHVSLLAAWTTDYRRSMLDSLARLMAVPDNYLAASASLLVPRGAACLREALGCLDLLPCLCVRELDARETLLVDTLLLPLSIGGDGAYHPCAMEFFRRLSATVAAAPTRRSRRLYIDRRGQSHLPLVNEPQLIAALLPLGFEPVRLEGMSLVDQIRLFRRAEAIVAPQGPELTNLGFASPGCAVVEILPDACVDWRFRHLSALAGLRYDCVLGRARRPWGDFDAKFFATPWDVSVNHVVACAARALGPTAKAA